MPVIMFLLHQTTQKRRVALVNAKHYETAKLPNGMDSIFIDKQLSQCKNFKKSLQIF